jgi:hypothetical protein
MCHERWASRRDELVETSWLHDLRSPRPERREPPRPRFLDDRPAPDEPAIELTDDEPIVVGER